MTILKKALNSWLRKWRNKKPPRNSLLTRCLPWLLALLGLACVIVVFYPGQMDFDSFRQLSQARSGEFNSHHPPAMSYLWMWIDRIWPGPFGMLLFHNILFWGALALLAHSLYQTTKSSAVLFLPLIGLTPPFFGPLGVIWKDVGTGSSFLAVFSITFTLTQIRERKTSVFLIGLSLALLWYGIAVRHNGILAAIPLAAYVATVVIEKFYNQRVHHVFVIACACGILFCALSYVGKGIFESHVTNGKRHLIWQYIRLYDLAGTSLHEDRSTFPEEIASRPDFALINVRMHYSWRTGDRLVLQWLGLKEELDEPIKLAWIEAVKTFPMTYLQHRWELFRELLGMRRLVSGSGYYHGIIRNIQTRNQLGINYKPTFAWPTANVYLKTFRRSFLFRGWVWFVVSTLSFLLAITPTGRFRRELWVLWLSGTLYLLPYFFVSVATSFRYLWWIVIAYCLTITFSAIGLLRRSPPSDKK